MNLLLSFEEYKNNGGLTLPIVNSYDQEMGITSSEQKYEKWAIYTQIQLNYVLQDKLVPAKYNLLNISVPYRQAIKDILTTRLNRAFENDYLIPRESNFNYSEGGSIQASGSSGGENSNYWNFWTDQELKMIEVSKLRTTINLYKQTNPTSSYPTTLTNDLLERLISSNQSIKILKAINPINNLDAINLEVGNIDVYTKDEVDEFLSKKQDNLTEIQLKNISEIPNIQQTAEEAKNGLKTKQDELSKEQLKNLDIIPNLINKDDINTYSLNNISINERLELLKSKYNLSYTMDGQVFTWKFANADLYNQVKKYQNDFVEQINWNDTNLTARVIWTEEQDFVKKCFAILENKYINKIDLTAFVSDKQLNYEVIKNNYEYANLGDVLKKWIWDKDVRWIGKINTNSSSPNLTSPITIECFRSWKNSETDIRANMIINIFRDGTSISYGQNVFYEKIEIPFNGLLFNEGRFFGGSVISLTYNGVWKIDNITDSYWRRLLYECKLVIERKERFK